MTDKTTTSECCVLCTL